jgi:hypothetical protein
LVDWVITSNQPFTVAEEQPFRRFIQYTHQGSESLHVPSSATIKRRVIDRSQECIEAQKAEFKASASMFMRLMI